jgi:hypothetical protein
MLPYVYNIFATNQFKISTFTIFAVGGVAGYIYPIVRGDTFAAGLSKVAKLERQISAVPEIVALTISSVAKKYITRAPIAIVTSTWAGMRGGNFDIAEGQVNSYIRWIVGYQAYREIKGPISKMLNARSNIEYSQARREIKEEINQNKEETDSYLKYANYLFTFLAPSTLKTIAFFAVALVTGIYGWASFVTFSASISSITNMVTFSLASSWFAVGTYEVIREVYKDWTKPTRAAAEHNERQGEMPIPVVNDNVGRAQPAVMQQVAPNNEQQVENNSLAEQVIERRNNGQQVENNGLAEQVIERRNNGQQVGNNGLAKRVIER